MKTIDDLIEWISKEISSLRYLGEIIPDAKRFAFSEALKKAQELKTNMETEKTRIIDKFTPEDSSRGDGRI